MRLNLEWCIDLATGQTAYIDIRYRASLSVVSLRMDELGRDALFLRGEFNLIRRCWTVLYKPHFMWESYQMIEVPIHEPIFSEVVIDQTLKALNQ